jgi:CBS domain containing-hemolysin-like protein
LDILQDLTVRDVFVPLEVTVVQRSLPLAVLLRQASESNQVVFPVTGEDGKPEGLITLDTIKAYLYDEDVGMLAIAADCESPFVSVKITDSLALALEQMAQTRYQQLPVVTQSCAEGESGAGSDQLVGLIAYDDLLQAYSRELAKRRRLGDSEPVTDPGPSES